MIENLKIIREILFKCFLISFVLIVFALLLLIYKFDYFAGLANSLIGIDRQTYMQAVFIIIGMYRNIVFLFFLIPAIAIHWTIKSHEKN